MLDSWILGICNSEILEDQTMYRLYEDNIDEGLGQEGTPDNFWLVYVALMG